MDTLVIVVVDVLVDEMLRLHEEIKSLSGQARDILDNRIKMTDRKIDRLVYALYGLTDDEIAIVEGK